MLSIITHITNFQQKLLKFCLLDYEILKVWNSMLRTFIRLNCFKFVFIEKGTGEDASMEVEDTILLVENRRSLISGGFWRRAVAPYFHVESNWYRGRVCERERERVFDFHWSVLNVIIFGLLLGFLKMGV